MHIISGKYARRKLKTPGGQSTRPPLTRFRRALFDTLMPFLPLGPYLDLFGGSGSFALEALSRGATAATIFEKSRDAVAIIQENLQAVGVAEPVEVCQGDSFLLLPQLARQGQKFAVIGVAPPYHQGMEAKALQLLDKLDLLLPQGVLFVQYAPHDDLGPVPPSLEVWKTRTYGQTSVAYFFPRER